MAPQILYRADSRKENQHNGTANRGGDGRVDPFHPLLRKQTHKRRRNRREYGVEQPAVIGTTHPFSLAIEGIQEFYPILVIGCHGQAYSLARGTASSAGKRGQASTL